METREQRRGLVGPVILITVGILFLLGNLGLLGWSAWELIYRFWPIVLIAIGLEVLIGRRSMAGSLIVLTIVVGLIGAILVFMPVQRSGTVMETSSISQPLEGARNANVDISFGAGAVRVGALQESNLLVEGTAAVEQGEQLTQSFQVSGDTASYRLGTRRGGPGLFMPHISRDGQGWNLSLNRDVPIRLKVDGGVGQANLDLSLLKISDLDANLGVGKTTISLPASGQFQARINGGVGEVEVVVPQGMAARIQAESGLGGVSVPGAYQKDGNTYFSPGYDSAQNRVDLRVRGGVGSVTVR